MKEVNINKLLYGENYEIIKIETSLNKNIIYLKSKVKEHKCPCCNQTSNNIHSTYLRKIQDTPIHCTETWIHITTYEFYCDNEYCENTCFVEELKFAKRYKKMTNSLIQLILSVSMFLSNSCASLVLSFMGVKTSPDTINRMFNNLEIEDNPDVKKIGIDDVAIRKGQTYATAIYDLETHKMLALLEGRSKEDVEEWLKEHKKITHIARDRASAYAAAINEILPNCIQIADRFHLFQNLLEYLKDIFYEEIPKNIFIKDGEVLDKAPKKVLKESKELEIKIKNINYDNTPPVDENGNIINYISKRRNIESEQYQIQEKQRVKKYKLILEIRKIYNELKGKKSYKYKQINKSLNVSISTITKYVNMTEDEVKHTLDINQYKDRKTNVDEYKNIIYKMHRDGHEKDIIFAYIISLGYDKSYRTLDNYIYLIGKNNFSEKRHELNIFHEYVYPNDVIVIKRSDLLKCILTLDPKKEKNSIIIENLAIIKNKYPSVEKIENIFKEFHEIIMGDDESKLDKFLNKYTESKIKSFCEGIKKDIAAVKQAISSKISSGFVEGNNNKFKLIKRIVYGKMKLVNLFKKCFVTFSSTKDDFNILDLI